MDGGEGGAGNSLVREYAQAHCSCVVRWVVEKRLFIDCSCKFGALFQLASCLHTTVGQSIVYALETVKGVDVFSLVVGMFLCQEWAQIQTHKAF